MRWVAASLVSLFLIPQLTTDAGAGTEYQGLDLDQQHMPDRSFEALSARFTAICDGILSSAKEKKLSFKQNRLLTRFIEQNQLFKQAGFDRAWLELTRKNFLLLEREEKNLIAPALFKTIEDFYKKQNSP